MKFCPLCQTDQAHFFVALPKRHKSDQWVENYHLCGHCHLMFLAPEDRVASEQEVARYHEHNNDPNQASYQNYLRTLWDRLRPLLSRGAQGLDFGCGPSEGMKKVAADDGFFVQSYDPFFFPHQEVFAKEWDFVLMCEVAEHLFEPGKELSRLVERLRPGGHIAIRTAMLEDWAGFSDWHYHNDRTHVVFYSPKTWLWVGRRFGLQVSFPAKDIVILRRAFNLD